MSGYDKFIEGKHLNVKAYGFDVADAQINRHAFAWQRDVIRWALKRGRAALFLDTGLGKTLCQLSWAENVCRETGGSVLLHCPVGVRWQTAKEAEKFEIECPVVVADEQSFVPKQGIAIANYEKLHKFDASKFEGVVLDESSILKGFTGKIKRALCDSWRDTRYKLACTATPSPNDHMELGNHADFLGIMASNEMLSRWFYNDTMHAGGYKILPHGEEDYWQWVASWAACVAMPSDIGGDDRGYILPQLTRIDHTVIVDDETPEPGQLFYKPVALTATTVHREKRRSTADRAGKVAEIIAAEPDEPWLIWCDTNYEADVLRKIIPDSVDLRGSESDTAKESKLDRFSSGDIKRLIAKPSMCGFGMNWQHCRRMAFIGLSYSYEQYYQAVRRCWRFGQQHTVDAHVVMAESESAILRANERKQSQHEQMQAGMLAAITRHHDLTNSDDLKKRDYETLTEMEIPKWLQRK